MKPAEHGVVPAVPSKHGSHSKVRAEAIAWDEQRLLGKSVQGISVEVAARLNCCRFLISDVSPEVVSDDGKAVSHSIKKAVHKVMLETRWEAEYEGHSLAVSRNEWTKGFKLEWDGEEIARRTWSWAGFGELHATAEVDGAPHEVRVGIHWGGLSALDGKCTIAVDGKEIPVTHVK